MIAEYDIDALGKIYVLSNVPSYLLKAFTGDLSIQAAANAVDTSDLKNALRGILKRKEIGFQDVIEAYAIIATLSIKPIDEVKSFFETLDKLPMKWSGDLKELYFATMKPSNTIVRALGFKSFAKAPTLKSSSHNQYQESVKRVEVKQI